VNKHPYQSLPHKAFWRKAVAQVRASEVDPVGDFDLRIGTETKVATAGSCFAQHIARYLRGYGYNYFVAEPGHPILPDEVREANNYGLFSCRYGNIYTARQLNQLMQRAYDRFHPREDVWIDEPQVVRDPFRPTSQPGGFVSEIEMRADREQHLAAVRRMFEQLDVFVFTLGLTECWRSRDDGAVFPLCPGVEGGAFDLERHEFHNQTVDEVVADLTDFVEALAQVNSGTAQVVLTVSPVPLTATAEPGAHVLSATTYSKSVLRVAAEAVRQRFGNVQYFPAYEIITGAFARGAYYAADLRNVVEDGVSHVMRLFMQHATGSRTLRPEQTGVDTPQRAYLAAAQRLVDVECDEIHLDAR
jgi:hypothetical protein